MKKLNTLKSFTKVGVAAFILLLAACSDDNSSGSSGNPDGFIKGKVDGQQFTSLEVQGHSTTVATRTGTGDGMTIMVSGSNQDLNTMTIITIGITQPGTYEIDSSDNSVLAFISQNDQLSYDTGECDGASGTLTITTLTDEKIEGTFSFVGKDGENCSASKTITNGSFRGVFMQS